MGEIIEMKRWIIYFKLELSDRGYEYRAQKFPAQVPQDLYGEILIRTSNKNLLLINTHI